MAVSMGGRFYMLEQPTFFDFTIRSMIFTNSQKTPLPTYFPVRHLVEHLDLIEGTSTEDLKSAPKPTRPFVDLRKPLKVLPDAPVRQLAAVPTLQVVAPPVRQMTPAAARPQKDEVPKKTKPKPKTLTKKQKEEEDVLAKVNSVIPPFSPCRERIRREEM